jgi:hypothetical protein
LLAGYNLIQFSTTEVSPQRFLRARQASASGGSVVVILDQQAAMYDSGITDQGGRRAHDRELHEDKPEAVELAARRRRTRLARRLLLVKHTLDETYAFFDEYLKPNR